MDAAKRAAQDAMHSAKNFAHKEAQVFAALPKYFRFRVYIIAAYVVLVGLSVVTMIPRAPRNRLSAYVLAARGDFIVGTYLLVRNDSPSDWHDVTFTVNGEHVLKTDWVVSGQSFPVKLRELKPPIAEQDVRNIRIECSRGSEQYEVSYGSPSQ